MGVTPAELDDAMQSVLIQIANRWQRLSALLPGEVHAYACTVASGVAIDVARKAGRSRAHRAALEDDAEHAEAKLGPEDVLSHKRDLEMLDLVLEALPEERREVFVLFELEELTLAEIADRLGIPAGTAASRLRKGREEFGRAAARLRSATDRGGGER